MTFQPILVALSLSRRTSFNLFSCAVAAASLAMLVQKADGSEPELLDGVKKLLPIVQSGQDILQASPPSPTPAIGASKMV